MFDTFNLRPIENTHDSYKNIILILISKFHALITDLKRFIKQTKKSKVHHHIIFLSHFNSMYYLYKNP